MKFLASSEKERRIGRIQISADILYEIFGKLAGDFIKEKIEILSIEYDLKKRNYYADCYSEKFKEVFRGEDIPVVCELLSRKDMTPTDAFRRTRKIGKIINKSQIEKRIIPKKKKIK